MMSKVTKQLINDAHAVLDSSDRVGAISVLERIVATLEKEPEPSKKWWVVALKVLAYLIGLLLAGMGTADAATLLIH